MSYKIGSFNCLNFGIGASKDENIFADIIQQENFDIVALQEIKGPYALRRILNHLPDYWAGISDGGYVNDYAFIWNKKRVALATTDVSGQTRTYAPHIVKQYRIDRKSGQQDLIREPFFARFVTIGPGAPKIEIRVINAHIRFSKGHSDDSSDEQTLGAIAMRRNEFDVLTKAIYTRLADKRYGNNLPAYTILLGDYNLNLPQSAAGSPYLLESFEVIDGQSVKRIVTEQANLTTLKKPKDSPDGQVQGFSSNYDHFTYDANRFSGVSVVCDSVDSVSHYCSGDYEKHLKSVSDHIPVTMDIDIRKG